MKTTAFIAASLDGFIARKDGDIQWLDDPRHTDVGEDYGYTALTAKIDAIVLGRRSFEKVLTFGDWPYGTLRVIVMARSPIDIPTAITDRVEVSAAAPEDLIADLASQGLKHLYIDGGQLIQSFLAARLLDELIITRIPRLLGAGIPLFGPLPDEIRLQHIETKAYPKGLVQSRYEVVHP